MKGMTYKTMKGGGNRGGGPTTMTGGKKAKGPTTETASKPQSNKRKR